MFLGDRIIMCVSRHRGNLIYTCCGALRQPRYRLGIVFPGSRETRQPRYKNKYNFVCIAAVVRLSCFSATERERERERERGYTTAAIYNSRDTKNFVFIFISRQPRESWQPCFKTKCQEIGTFIRSLFLVLDNLAFMTFLFWSYLAHSVWNF